MGPAYARIREMPRDTVLLELPATRFHHLAMYNSTFHFQKLANGRSGIIPPVTHRLYLLTDPHEPFCFGPPLLDHLLETGVNTVLVHRSWSNKAENQLILRGLSRMRCLEPLGQFRGRDLLFRIAARRGSPGDVSLIATDPARDADTAGEGARPLNTGEPSEVGGKPIPLAAGEAYPRGSRYKPGFGVAGGRLAIYAPAAIRWLAKLPSGEYQLAMSVSGMDGPENKGKPISVRMQVAGSEALAESLVGARQILYGTPFRVRRSAHYPIDLQVARGTEPGLLRLEVEELCLRPLDGR
jgi:hypothetical protein